MSDEVKPSEANREGREVAPAAFAPERLPRPSVLVEASQGSDFEEAVEATGYGFFNHLLLLSVVPAGITNFFDTTAMSYVLPSAECDLQLTLFQKGMLNAAIYAGMISSAFVWGFLADTRGRRPLLVFGFSADFVCNFLSSMSQSFGAMVVFKFISGCLISGPFVITLAYFAEFHGAKHRSRTFLWARLSPCVANVLLPGMAWLIIPQSWSLELFDGAFVYNSWRIFILCCSIAPLLALLALSYFPESPRFLMSRGRNDEALEVFRRMYAANTGNPPDAFPVRTLRREDRRRDTEAGPGVRRSASLWSETRKGWAQIRPLFKSPYVREFLLIATIQLGGLLSLNTLRLWVPQLFALIEKYEGEDRDPGRGAPTLCDMIGPRDSPVAADRYSDSDPATPNACVATPVGSAVYVNSMIIAATSAIGYAIAGYAINPLGAKRILLPAYAIPALCSFALNWSPSSDVTLALVSVYMAFVNITVTVVMSVIVESMPTSLRTTAGSLVMCLGRCGAMIGNLLFPILLAAGCMVPFVFVGGFLLGSFVLSIFIRKPPPKLM